MSRIACPGVSHPMIIDGGMMAPPTSLADNRMFTNRAGIVMPPSSMSVVVMVTAASWGRVTFGRMLWPP